MNDVLYAKLPFPRKNLDIYNASIRAHGNIRNLFTYMEGYDEIDDFKCPKVNATAV